MCRYVLAFILTIAPFMVGYVLGFKHGFRAAKKEHAKPQGSDQ